MSNPVKILTREAIILGSLIVSATIICIVDKSMSPRWFDLMYTIVGGILGFAAQTAFRGLESAEYRAEEYKEIVSLQTDSRNRE
jgi:hypothetical protein